MVVDVKVTVHDDAVEFSVVKVQLEPTLPGPAVLNDTIPPGADFVPELVSVTVALTVDVAPPAILVGFADTVVAVDLAPTVTEPEPELVACVLSDAV